MTDRYIHGTLVSVLCGVYRYELVGGGGYQSDVMVIGRT